MEFDKDKVLGSRPSKIRAWIRGVRIARMREDIILIEEVVTTCRFIRQERLGIG